MTRNQKGFATVEAVLVVIIIAIVGFTGWFAWHSKKSADSSLNAANKSAQTTVPKTTVKAVTSFADCKAAKGSKTLTTYPEQCVTKDGKTFTDKTQSTQKYLIIKEWGVRIPLSAADSGAYYKIDPTVQQSSVSPTNLTVYATQIDNLAGPAGVSCAGEYIAYLLRLPVNDLRWQPSASIDDGNVSPLFGNRTAVGDYRYAIATKKQYGPECWETSKTGDYIPDTATSQKFGNIVSAFTADFKNITAD